MENQMFLRPVLSGLFTVIAILFFVSLFLSLLLHFTAIEEASLSVFLLPITLVTLFIGGLIAGFKSGKKGWYFGGLTGIGFILLSWLISFLGFEQSFSGSAAWQYVLYMLPALLGGIIGVNVSPHKRT